MQICTHNCVGMFHNIVHDEKTLVIPYLNGFFFFPLQDRTGHCRVSQQSTSVSTRAWATVSRQ